MFRTTRKEKGDGNSERFFGCVAWHSSDPHVPTSTLTTDFQRLWDPPHALPRKKPQREKWALELIKIS